MSPDKKQKILEEAARRFTFNLNYNPAKPTNYPSLLEIKGNDKTVFTYDLLTQMREGRVSPIHPIFEVLPNVRDILLTEAYDTFSEFMAKLSTSKHQLQNPNNIIRQTYEKFKKGIPQQWKLIDPDEYLRCMQEFTHSYVEPLTNSFTGFEKQKPQFGATEDYWARKIVDWVADAKDNIAQFAANSYLHSGPTLGRTDTNEKGQNLLALLWYNLTGDEDIPYHPSEREEEEQEENEYDYGYGISDERPDETEFYSNYINKFRDYIQTKFGKGAESLETDSPLDGFFNIIAGFDRSYSDFKKMFATLDKLKNLCHGRGGLGHLIMKGGNAACERICNTPIYNRWSGQMN